MNSYVLTLGSSSIAVISASLAAKMGSSAHQLGMACDFSSECGKAHTKKLHMKLEF